MISREMIHEYINTSTAPVEWRKGQKVFNLVHYWNPIIANILRASPWDPFRQNERIDDFIHIVTDLTNIGIIMNKIGEPEIAWQNESTIIISLGDIKVTYFPKNIHTENFLYMNDSYITINQLKDETRRSN